MGRDNLQGRTAKVVEKGVPTSLDKGLNLLVLDSLHMAPVIITRKLLKYPNYCSFEIISQNFQ